MAGPIDFASDGPRDEKGPTEYGGRAGLIQTGEGVFQHEMDGPERRGVLVRSKAAEHVDAATGLSVVDAGGNAVDPVTGQVVDTSWNEDGAHAKSAVDPLRAGDPRSAELT